MEQYEFIEVEGDRREGSSIYKYAVSIDDLNEYGKKGWKFAYTANEGHTVVMQRKICDEP